MVTRERRIVPSDFRARPLGLEEKKEIVNGHDLRRAPGRDQKGVRRVHDVE